MACMHFVCDHTHSCEYVHTELHYRPSCWYCKIFPIYSFSFKIILKTQSICKTCVTLMAFGSQESSVKNQRQVLVEPCQVLLIVLYTGIMEIK